MKQDSYSITTPGAMADLESIMAVDISLLRQSQTNPRRTANPEGLVELVNSIRQDGILVPLLVRPMLGPDLFEIVDGHRRYEAALKAEVPTVPVRARMMTDQEVAEIQVIANLQREDVHPLDEASGFATLLENVANRGMGESQTGLVANVARRTGKEESYIARRLQLLTLIPEAKAMFQENILTIDHALLLCRLPAEDQAPALHWTLNRNYTRKDKLADAVHNARKEQDRRPGDQARGYRNYWEPQSAKELKAHIENSLKLELKRAPWKLDDALLLPEAGACTECPKQTAANQALFSDLSVSGATCTDSTCFRAKQTAFVQLRIQEEQEKGPLKTLRISYKASTATPRWVKDEVDKIPNPDQVFKAGQWVEAKKGSCAIILPAITVDYQEERHYAGEPMGGKPGVRKLVCIEPACKVHRKAYVKVKGRAGGSDHGEQEWQKRQREQKEREAREKPLRAKLTELILAKVTGVGPREIHFMIARAVDGNFNFYGPARDRVLELLQLKPSKMWKDDQVHAAIAKLDAGSIVLGHVMVLIGIDDELEPHLYSPEGLQSSRKRMIAFCQHFGVTNAAKVIADYDAQFAKPAPKDQGAKQKKAAAEKRASAKKPAKAKKAAATK